MAKIDKMKAVWAEQDEALIKQAVEALLQLSNGRKFLWWLLEIGRIGSQPYSGNALNTAFSCGELNVGQKVLDRIIATSPDGYVIMMKEQADVNRERSNAIANARAEYSEHPGDGADNAD